MSIYDDPAILIYVCFVTAVLGLVFGSFLNCAAWRIARGERMDIADCPLHAVFCDVPLALRNDATDGL